MGVAVLILVVVDDDLVRYKRKLDKTWGKVLILVVVDDDLVHIKIFTNASFDGLS